MSLSNRDSRSLIQAAIYTRISTRTQNAEGQARQLREYVSARGWHLAAEYADTISGAADRMPAWREMLTAAHQQRIEVVVFWALDRLGRSGIKRTLDALAELDRARLVYVSYTEPEISTEGPMGELFVAIKAAFARVELESIRRRTRAGQDRARAQGKQIGRPARIVNADRIAAMKEQGSSVREVARALGISPATAARRLAAPQSAHKYMAEAATTDATASQPVIESELVPVSSSKGTPDATSASTEYPVL